MIATKHIPKGSLVAFIPDSYLIFKTDVVDSDIYRTMEEKNVDIKSLKYSSTFAVYMMEQKRLGKDGKFLGYINTLPESWTEFPLMWSDQDLDNLKGSPLL